MDARRKCIKITKREKQTNGLADAGEIKHQYHTNEFKQRSTAVTQIDKRIRRKNNYGRKCRVILKDSQTINIFKEKLEC